MDEDGGDYTNMKSSFRRVKSIPGQTSNRLWSLLTYEQFLDAALSQLSVTGT